MYQVKTMTARLPCRIVSLYELLSDGTRPKEIISSRRKDEAIQTKLKTLEEKKFRFLKGILIICSVLQSS